MNIHQHPREDYLPKSLGHSQLFCETGWCTVQTDLQACHRAVSKYHCRLRSGLWWWRSSLGVGMNLGLLMHRCFSYSSSSFFPPLPFSSPLTDKQVKEDNIRSVFIRKPVLMLVSGTYWYFTLATQNLEFHARHKRKTSDLFIRF